MAVLGVEGAVMQHWLHGRSGNAGWFVLHGPWLVQVVQLLSCESYSVNVVSDSCLQVVNPLCFSAGQFVSVAAFILPFLTGQVVATWGGVPCQYNSPKVSIPNPGYVHLHAAVSDPAFSDRGLGTTQLMART